MKRGIEILLVGLMMLIMASCTEDFIIDVEEGERMIGVEAYFSDEMKQHEIILSYTADFYNTDEIKMISGATVFVTDGVDTIPYIEDRENKGHYFTEIVAGKKNTVYLLRIDVTEANGEVAHLSSECLIPDNIERIDSLVIKPFNGANDTIPTVMFGDTIEWVYPYFQSLPDPNIVYLPIIYKNDTIINDSLMQQMTIPVGGYAGYYINGPEMQAENKEIPVYYFSKKKLKDGDRIRLDLRSIQPEYLYFYYNVAMSTGSNPMMGAPANVNTNIYPVEKAVGWFLTASSVTVETTFIDNHPNTEPR